MNVAETARTPLRWLSSWRERLGRLLGRGGQGQAAEVALRESMKRFKALSALSSDWFWQQDENFRFIEFFGEFGAGFNPPTTSLGRTRWDLGMIQLSPAQWAAHRKILDAHLPIEDFEYPIVLANGELHWYSVNGEPLFDETGRFTGYHGTGRDVTKLKLAEQELRVAAAAFELQESMLVTDVHTTMLRVNRAFTAMTGYSAAEAVGQTPRLLQSDRHDAAFFAAMWDSIRRTGGWQGEIWNRRKNGEVFPVWQVITTVENEEGLITHFVAAQTDITDRKAAQEEIERLAFHDHLTKLPNRRLLTDRVQQAMATSKRTQRYAALLFIDLDHFKTLNDTQGHNVGDLLLQQVAQRLRAAVRDEDTVARLGGDEFVVLLENLSERADEAASQAKGVGTKIHGVLNQPYQLDQQTHQSGASIGIALFHQQSDTVDDLLKQADTAMYQAKKSGRNTVCFLDAVAVRSAA